MLVFTTTPVRDEDCKIELSKNGTSLYEQRNMDFSETLLEVLVELSYTHSASTPRADGAG